MSNAKGFAIDWLVDESCRTKAFLKYEIKQIENRLQKAMGDGKNTRMRISDAAQYCSELAAKYDDLLYLLKPGYLQETDLTISISENNPSRCYVTIQTLKQQFNVSMAISEEIKITWKLKHYYQYLQGQLNGLQPQSVEYIQRSLTGQLKQLIESQTCAEWLHAAVVFANDAGENILSSLALLAQLNDKEMLQLAALFEKSDIIFTVNNLFFYKSNPHQLFKQALHPEKLLSVKARLSMLHQFIESMHQTIMQSLKQRGIGELHDYLLHGDDLPQGVTIAMDDEVHKLIISALKEWRLPTIILSNELVEKNKLNNLFRAYKFWFNPNRLIDTVMTLQQQLGHSPDVNDNYMKFSSYMQEMFHQLSTTECLDLYGYFANKDSCYLMRSLAAVLDDQKIAALPLATQEQKEAIGRVYRALDCAMEAIRHELLNRHITTIPYTRCNTHKSLKPGRRNLDAITRIMALYSNPVVLENKTLEQLFQEAGGNL
ncbi:hypothetical protein [Legionella hackeliae]|uniref:Uncharacterized protein n=1 Tax=Legionella hackeliae TaxID=449 RepID=A0A0A8UR64_LEGHA|nr:hypothetical protein [Legionella hackeliae]KTD14812.1 hypothetical protein Lhac_0342 [Legionella hackeliae]CEK09562.1 conserved protein of unknown function [Legionella hackeliae]STX49472.1 Uncharacterised protein [Legionella hackeliae]